MTTASPSTQGAHNLTAQDMIVATVDSHPQAEQIVHKLVEAGVPAEHISLLTQGLELREHLQGFITAGDVTRTSAGVGAWTGGLFGLLAGAAFLWVPAFGPLIVLGPLVGAALGAAEGGIAGGLLGAIMGQQIEQEHIPKYEAALRGGKVLVVVHGSPQELETARRVVSENGGHDVATYAANAV